MRGGGTSINSAASRSDDVSLPSRHDDVTLQSRHDDVTHASHSPPNHGVTHEVSTLNSAPELTMWQRVLTSRFGDVTSTGCGSALPSFVELPSMDEFVALVPEDTTLPNMTRDELQVLVTRISHKMASLSALDTAHAQPSTFGCDATHTSATSTNQACNQSNATTDDVTTHLVCVDCQRLRAQLDAVLFGPTSNEDARIIPILKQQLLTAQTQTSTDDDVTSLRAQLRVGGGSGASQAASVTQR